MSRWELLIDMAERIVWKSAGPKTTPSGKPQKDREFGPMRWSIVLVVILKIILLAYIVLFAPDLFEVYLSHIVK
jgi:hypothetical protein